MGKRVARERPLRNCHCIELCGKLGMFLHGGLSEAFDGFACTFEASEGFTVFSSLES